MINGCKHNEVLHYSWSTFSSKLKKYFKLLLCLLAISGCSKEIELELTSDRALVLNSIFNPDSAFLFRISFTASPLDDYTLGNDTFHLFLYEENDLLIDTLFSGNYIAFNKIPSINKKYTVELGTSDLPSVQATDSIPELVYIDDAFIIYPAGVDAYGDNLAEANIRFTDPGNQQNFYELLIWSGEEQINYWDWDGDVRITDPVLLNEGDIDYFPSTLFFSDELIDGKSYIMKIKQAVGYSLNNDGSNKTGLSVTLRSVSKSYYLYRKYYTRHKYNQQFQGDFFDLIYKGEPQIMYTNVENGFGIFAGYQETTREIYYAD
jgi:hypothetical protein